MADEVHVWTDERIAKLELELQNHYVEATAQMMQKQEIFLEVYDREKSRLDDKLRSMKITKAEYKRQMAEYTMKKEWFEGMINSLTEGAITADQHAMDMINRELPRIYAENYNFGTYQVESGLKINTNFTLMDENTLRNLLINKPDLLPKAQLDAAKDASWNKQKFNSAITQSIMQGEGIEAMTARIQSVMGMNERSASRSARTAATAAQNAGRQQSYERMKDYGIEVRKQWMATLDKRTRDTHRREDGEIVNIDEDFPNTGLQYPGDPDGAPAEVYNCRCTMIASFEEIDMEQAPRFDRFEFDETYEDWKEGHQ